MTNDTWKTVRVPPEAYERAQEQRQAADRTWGEQIVRQDDSDDEWAMVKLTDDQMERLLESGSIDTTDVYNACRKAIEEELTDMRER